MPLFAAIHLRYDACMALCLARLRGELRQPLPLAAAQYGPCGKITAILSRDQRKRSLQMIRFTKFSLCAQLLFLR
jgi:hypothetical protein